MRPDELCVTGTGAVSAVGLTAAQTCSSVRAGVAGFRLHPHHWSNVDPPYRDRPEPLTCAPVALLDALDRAPDRILTLALAVLQELFASARLRRGDLGDAGLFLAAPPVVEGVPEWGLEEYLLPEFFRRAALAPLPLTGLERSGATGFVRALRRAQQALREERCRVALVGAVDSYLDEHSVKLFDAAYRLKSTRNRDGFIPGEAAAFVVVESARSAAERGAPVLGRVAGPALDRETQALTGTANSTGAGLAGAIGSSLAVAGAEPDWVVCDLNGESYRAYEWGLVRVRLAASLEKVAALWHPADCLGDVRAAGPALGAVLACEAFRKGYAPGAACLVFAGEDGGERGAFVVTRPG